MRSRLARNQRRSTAADPAVARRRRRAQHRRAFSLIEVMFAGAILIISLTAVASVFGATRVALATHRDVAAATVIAEAFLEQVVVLPRSSPMLSAGAHPARRFRQDTRPGGADAPFQLVWTVTEDEPVPGMRSVRVDVTWTRDRPHTLTFTTFRE
jgi:type II secretory pathway pseudopilin PulG